MMASAGMTTATALVPTGVLNKWMQPWTACIVAEAVVSVCFEVHLCFALHVVVSYAVCAKHRCRCLEVLRILLSSAETCLMHVWCGGTVHSQSCKTRRKRVPGAAAGPGGKQSSLQLDGLPPTTELAVLHKLSCLGCCCSASCRCHSSTGGSWHAQHAGCYCCGPSGHEPGY
jgi:hypothetical protein